MALETIAGIAAIAGGTAGVGTAAYSMLNAPKGPKAPIVPKPNQAATEAAYAEAESLKKRRGFGSTILTGPGGVQGQPTTLKTALGA